MKRVIIFLVFFLQSLFLFGQEVPNVTITGKLLNSKIPIIISLLKDEAMVTPPVKIKASILADSSFLLRFYISKAIPINLINQTFFCEPNDSINVVIEGSLPFPKMTFSGNHAPRYNFLVEMFELKRRNREQENLLLDEFKNDASKLLLYKQQLQRIFAVRNNSLADFYIKHLSTQAFKDFAYSQLQYEYLYLLSLNYSGILDVDRNILESYFSELKPSLVQNSKYAQAPEYSLALFSTLRNYWVKPLKDESDSSIIERQFRYINQNFSGLTKDILFARFFTFYFQKGEKTYKDVLNLKYRGENFIDKNYIEVLKPYFDKYNLFDLKLNKYVNVLIFDSNKNKKSIGALISNLNGYVIYLNFWASWCGPCLTEMPFFNKLKEEYKDKKIYFVNISIDDDWFAWTKAIAKCQIDGQNTFLMDKESLKNFKKDLFLNSIPRAILIDKNGKIADADSFLPGNPHLLQKINQLLE